MPDAKQLTMLYKHSIATVSLSGTLSQKMNAIARAGYDGVELFENDLLVSDLTPAELGRMATDLGLEIVALQPFRDYEAMPTAQKLKNLERAEHKFDLMEALGTRTLFVCSNVSPLAINNIDRAAGDLADLANRAALRGFSVGYEALSWGHWVADYRQAAEIVRRANRPNLGHILDSFHIGVIGSDMSEIRAIPGDTITIVQLADAPKYDMGTMHLSRHYRCFPGQGSLPVVAFMEAVAATGYKGYISHEIFSDEFRASMLNPTALDGKRSLVWIEGITADANPSFTNNPVNQPIALRDLEFVEFATSPEEQNALIHLLSNLGFAETHRHRTKDVSLYQAGAINIVLNRQPHSYAASYVDKHGSGVCAIGLRGANPDTAATWASQLQYDWIDSQTESDELNLSAVRGFGDVLYYLVDGNTSPETLYATEFSPTGHRSIDNGLTRVDHIGHTVSADHFQSNTLFHRAMLGLDVEESLDLFDPHGIVYSRVVKNKDSRIRISLNSTGRPTVRDRGTSSDQFITASSGAGIQQVALATTDIFQTANCIQNKDLLLPIPANYYDDLRAKSVLPELVIIRMQAANILFDQQGNGQFYHFYLKELNGLFVEVVQRTNGYDRYGEVNAQVRLAAQARQRSV